MIRSWCVVRRGEVGGQLRREDVVASSQAWLQVAARGHDRPVRVTWAPDEDGLRGHVDLSVDEARQLAAELLQVAGRVKP